MTALEPGGRVKISLLALRFGIVLLMAPWAIDKLLRPDHAISVLSRFSFVGELLYPFIFPAGVAQLAVIAAFATGWARTWTYGAVLAMHAVSTLSTWCEYLQPYEGANLPYFAAWPALGACFALFLLREQDTLLSVATQDGAGVRRTPRPSSSPS
jgi:putative oxidoreductase